MSDAANRLEAEISARTDGFEAAINKTAAEARKLGDSAKKAGDDASKSFDKAEKSTEQWRDKLSKLADDASAMGRKFSTFMTLPIAAATGAGIAMASDLGESMNALRVVFGDASGEIEEFGKTAASSFGLTRTEVNSAATAVGSQLQNMGYSAREAAVWTRDLTRRAADMASVFNTSVGDALTAIQAALRGQADPIEKYGVAVNMAAIEAKALSMGLIESTSEMTEQIKVAARLQIIMEQTARVEGDFANTADSLANSSKILGAQVKELGAQLGEVLLPFVQEVVSGARELVSGWMDLDEGTKRVIISVAAAAASFGPLLSAFGAFAKAVATFKATNAWLFVGGAALAGLIGLVTHFQLAARAAEEMRQAAIDNTIAIRRLDEQWGSLNQEQAIGETRYNQLIAIYPQLRDQIDANNTSLAEALRITKELNEAERERERVALQSQIAELEVKKAEATARVSAMQETLNRHLRMGQELQDPRWIRDHQDAMAVWAEEAEKTGKQLDALNESLEKLNQAETGELPTESVPDALMPTPESTGDAVKSWRTWWKEVTGQAVEGSGADAAKAFVNSFARERSASKELADALGEKFSEASSLLGEQQALREVLETLLKIPASEIDEQFKVVDDSIQGIIDRYLELGVLLAEQPLSDVVKQTGGEIDDALVGAVEAIRERFASETEVLAEELEEQQQVLWKALSKQLISVEDYHSLREALERDHQQTIEDIQSEALQRQVDMQISAWSGLANNIVSIWSGLASAQTEEEKKMFEITKAARTAQAVISGISAAVESFRVGAALGGPVLGGVFASASLLATGAMIADIQSQTFKGGGSKGSAPTASVPQAASTEQAAGGTPQNVYLQLQGSYFSAADVRGLINAINEQADDGVRIQVV